VGRKVPVFLVECETVFRPYQKLPMGYLPFPRRSISKYSWILFLNLAPILKTTWNEEFWMKVVGAQMDLFLLGQQSVEETIRKITMEGNKYAKSGP
jgi:hypothetical protein